MLGVSTADIGRLFLVSTPTMAARLTRARKSLAHERFEVPRGAELDVRVRLAADIAYLAFTAGYAPASGPDVVRTDLSAEAIRLVRVLRELLPEHTEIDALLALVLLQHSRRDARVRDGEVVLLAEQDRTLWHPDEVDEALELLRPLTDAPAAPYLLQALIAAEHAIAPAAANTDWTRIADRYASSRTSPARPWSASTGPSPSRRRTGRSPGSRWSTASTCRATGCPAYGPSCSAEPAGTPRRATSSTGPSPPATTTRSDATSSSAARLSEHRASLCQGRLDTALARGRL